MAYCLNGKKIKYVIIVSKLPINLLTPNDPYMGRTAPLTSKRYILYIYSTNICTEYFKHALYSRFFNLQNAVCFIMLTCLVPVLFTFYIQSVLKLKKKNNSCAKGLIVVYSQHCRHLRMCSNGSYSKDSEESHLMLFCILFWYFPEGWMEACRAGST